MRGQGTRRFKTARLKGGRYEGDCKGNICRARCFAQDELKGAALT
jgi:hypothetical protein